MIFIFFCYIFADIAFHVKAMFLSPFNEFHFVHQPCTNGIWPMYEWYMANVRNGLFILPFFIYTNALRLTILNFSILLVIKMTEVHIFV